MKTLSSIRIILVNTTHPGNIGAVARAMKNMGLSQLSLVNPKRFPDIEATTRAAGADDILASARIEKSLGDAIKDCSLVIGTSARVRGIPWPMQDLRSATQQIVQEAQQSNVCVVFGCEQYGLTNEELSHCHSMMNIPANPNFSSLNLSQAVQIICYEIYQSALVLQEVHKEEDLVACTSQSSQQEYFNELDQLASAEEMQKFYDHLQQTLIDIEFLKPENPRKLMRRLMRLFNRARMEKREVNIIRGILSALTNSTRKKPVLSKLQVCDSDRFLKAQTIIE